MMSTSDTENASDTSDKGGPVGLPALAPVEAVIDLPDGKIACFMHSLGRCTKQTVWPRGAAIKNRTTLVNGDGVLAPFGAKLLDTTGFTDEHLARCKRGAREPLYLCRVCKTDFDLFLELDHSTRYNLDVVNI